MSFGAARWDATASALFAVLEADGALDHTTELDKLAAFDGRDPGVGDVANAG